MVCPFCNIPSAHIGPFRLRILYQCLSLHAGDSSSFSSTTLRFPRFLQTSLQLYLSPNGPLGRSLIQLGGTTNPLYGDNHLLSCPPPSQPAQSSPKKPPWKVKCGEKVLQCCNFLIRLFYLTSGITSVRQSKVCAPIWNENHNFNVCVTNFLTFSLIHTQTPKVMTRQNVKSKIRNALSNAILTKCSGL